MKETASDKVINAIIILLLLLVVIITLYPILYILFASVSDPKQLMAHQGGIYWPLGFSLESYKAVLQNEFIAVGYKNTLIIVAVTVVINLITSSIGGYFFSRRDVKFQKPLMFLIMVTMFFSGGMVPFYLVVKGLGLYDNIWAVILPASVSTYHILIARTTFYGLPASIEEAAYLDGAGHYDILVKIILPLNKAILAVLALYTAVGQWNGWFNATIFLSSKSKWPLQLFLRDILLQEQTMNIMGGTGMSDFETVSNSIKYSVIVVSTLPILLVYPFLQKYFVKGVLIGAVKG